MSSKTISVLIDLEISIIKQTTTITTEEYTEIKKEKADLGHIMISYNHSTRPLCLKIAKELKVEKNENDFVFEIHMKNI